MVAKSEIDTTCGACGGTGVVLCGRCLQGKETCEVCFGVGDIVPHLHRQPRSARNLRSCTEEEVFKVKGRAAVLFAKGKDGCSNHAIAKHLAVSYQTVQNWRERWEDARGEGKLWPVQVWKEADYKPARREEKRYDLRGGGVKGGGGKYVDGKWVASAEAGPRRQGPFVFVDAEPLAVGAESNQNLSSLTKSSASVEELRAQRAALDAAIASAERAGTGRGAAETAARMEAAAARGSEEAAEFKGKVASMLLSDEPIDPSEEFDDAEFEDEEQDDAGDDADPAAAAAADDSNTEFEDDNEEP